LSGKIEGSKENREKKIRGRVKKEKPAKIRDTRKKV